MSDLKIIDEVADSKGRFVIKTPHGDAELTFSILSPALRTADHTEVPKSLVGQGVAYKFVQDLIEDAKAKGYKIVPLCPYVNTQRAKHSEWAEFFSV